MNNLTELFSELRSQLKSDLSDFKNEIHARTLSKGLLIEVKKHPHYYLLLGIMLVSLLIFYICINITHGKCYHDELFYQPGDIWDDMFMDFYNMIRPVYMDDPYTQTQAMYPPICFLIMALFGLCLGEENVPHDFGAFYEGIDYFTMLEIRNSQTALWVCIAFLLINFLLLISMLNKILRDKGLKNILLFDICILFSYPCMMVIQRGNLVLFTLNFILFYFVSQSSKSKFVQELGLVSLAIGIDTKLYPVILSVYLLSKKEFSKFVRLALYCIFFWLFPYAFWGGLDGLIANVKSVFVVSAGIAPRYPGNNINASSLIYLTEILSGQADDITAFLKKILPTFFLVFGSVSSLFLKKDWKKVLLLVCTLLLFPSSTVTYNMILLFIPLVLFLVDENKTKFDYVYVLLFSMCFIHVPYVVCNVHEKLDLGDGPNITAGFILLCVSVVTMTFLLIGEGIFNLIRLGFNTKFKTNEDIVDTYYPVAQRRPRIKIKYCTITICVLLGCSMAVAALRFIFLNDYKLFTLEGLKFAAAILPSVIFLHMSMVFKDSKLNLKSFWVNGKNIIPYILFYSLLILAGTVITKVVYDVPIGFATARFFLGVFLSVITAWFIHLSLNLIVKKKSKRLSMNDIVFLVILALNVLTYLPIGDVKFLDPYYLICGYLKTGVDSNEGCLHLVYQLCVYALLALWGVVLHLKYYVDGYKEKVMVKNKKRES